MKSENPDSAVNPAELDAAARTLELASQAADRDLAMKMTARAEARMAELGAVGVGSGGGHLKPQLQSHVPRVVARKRHVRKRLHREAKAAAK